MPVKKRSKKKSGKYTPLIWLLTGALIAFVISYSGSLKNIKWPLSQKNPVNAGTNGISLPVNITNLIPMPENPANKTNMQPVKTNIVKTNVVRTVVTVTNASVQNGITVKIFLASQKGKDIVLVEKPVVIPRGQSVLKDTLEALINYRDADLLNMVPLNSKVKKVWIKGDIAYVDFSEDFSYNSYGLTGYKVQVYQVVYTATQFAQVKAVYFYIEGKPAEYLGGDGYPLHNPIYPFSSLPVFTM